MSTTRTFPQFRLALSLLALATAALVPSASATASTEPSLEHRFKQPDVDSKVWVFWYWMSGNVTREGITHDLEAMARAGLGGAYIFAIDRPHYEAYVKVPEPVRAPTQLFWDHVKFAAQEAKRLGLQIAINASDGWSLAGGPWITPELSMQKLVSTTLVVEGGQATTFQLKRPPQDIKEGMWTITEHADYYRDIAVLAYPASPEWSGLSNTHLASAQRIKHVETKAGVKAPRYSMDAAPAWLTENELSNESCVPKARVLNLSDQMDTDGHLRWTPPPGKWIVQRFGYTTTGETNRPAGGPGRGLEVDKFNPEASRVQFENWFGKISRQLGPDLAHTLSINHSDSWECGGQNWSPVFRDEFIKRRGYDPVPYLPVTTGIPIGSAEISERFLWDLRRTIVDLVSDGFFRTSVALTRQAGAIYSSETVAGTVTDSLEFYREVDLPMAEFWVASEDQGAPMLPRGVSGAHIYGKRIIQTESFTERGIKWIEDPYFLKPLGDYAYSRGINRIALHVWALQPFPDRVPGATLFNVYGTTFGGHQPWHDVGRSWYDYMHRSQALLQTGLPVVDVCYFIGEELPADAIQRQDLKPGLPQGYDYDCINRDALLTRASAKNGRLVLPDGMSYAVLVLPDSKRMSPEVARKVGELAQAGVPVIGPKPHRTYSLALYPASDLELQRIVSDSWGKVRPDTTPAEVLAARRTPFDVEFLGVSSAWIHRGKKMLTKHANWNQPKAEASVRHQPELGTEYSSPSLVATHRQTNDADVYFVANQDLKKQNVQVAFRVTGRQPELWHPETGAMRPLTDWSVKEGRTFIPLQFGPAESYFIVFRQAAQPPASAQPNFPSFTPLANVDGAWSVEFQAKRGAPARVELPKLLSWPQHTDPGVQAFSGVATYRHTLKIPANLLAQAKGQRIVLDLGEVKNAAEVTLNGHVFPGVWKPPFQIDVTDALRSGDNDLTVRVANTWKNRLLADSALPPNQRVTWTLFREKEGWFNPAKDKPEPAGLLGPVQLLRQH